MPYDFLNAIENVPLKNTKIDGIILAADLVTKRRYNEAKKVLEKILKISPNDAGVMCLLANVHIMDEKYSDAEKWHDKALSIEAENPQALYHMGVVYYEQGKFDKAIEMYQDAIKSFPKKNKHDIAEAYQNLGCSLWEARRREEALDAWKTCLKYNVKGKDSFDDTDDEKAILKKIIDAWNTHIAGKFGKTLDRMKTKEKMELFNEIKVFTQ